MSLMPVASSSSRNQKWLVEPSVPPVRMVPGAFLAAATSSLASFHGTFLLAPMMGEVRVSMATGSNASQVKFTRPVRKLDSALWWMANRVQPSALALRATLAPLLPPWPEILTI